MNITKTKFISILDEMQTEYDRQNNADKSIANMLGISKRSLIAGLGANALSIAVKLLEIAIGDNDYWISWYAYDCDFGRKGLTVKLCNGKEVKVNSHKKLWKVLKHEVSQTAIDDAAADWGKCFEAMGNEVPKTSDLWGSPLSQKDKPKESPSNAIDELKDVINKLENQGKGDDCKSGDYSDSLLNEIELDGLSRAFLDDKHFFPSVVAKVNEREGISVHYRHGEAFELYAFDNWEGAVYFKRANELIFNSMYDRRDWHVSDKGTRYTWDINPIYKNYIDHHFGGKDIGLTQFFKLAKDNKNHVY